MIIQGPEAPPGGFVRNAAAIKRAVGEHRAGQRRPAPQRPDVRRGGAPRREKLDFVTLSRAFHADPTTSARSRRDAPTRSCRASPAITARTCSRQHAGALRREPELGPRAAPPDRARRQAASRDVVGGGPAGMQAARVLALQGNRVTLHEQQESLGGQMRYSSEVAPDYGYLVDVSGRPTRQPGGRCSARAARSTSRR